MIKFNNQTLAQYINENNILLTEDYSEQKINKDTFINGNCLTKNCDKIFSKKFIQLVKTEAYCSECTNKNGIIKIRNKTITYNYNKLMTYCNENSIELINDYSDKLMGKDYYIEGKCKTEGCNNTFNKNFRSLLKIGGYCYDCSKENGKVKIRKTNLEKYGSEHGMLALHNREALQEATMKKFGKKFYSQTDEYKEKVKQTYLQKYGTEHILQLPKIREMIIETNIKKYGVPNPQQNENVRNKLKETNLKRYGKDNYFKTDEFKQKIKQIFLRKYGKEYYTMTDEYKIKSKKTNMEKYGCEYPLQNKEISEKICKHSYRLKDYTLPSGKIIKYQGYEHFAYNELLLVQNLDENELITSRIEVPEIWYDDDNGKRHRYYVDIFIPSQNKCIEVKSTWTMKKSRFIFEKQQSVKQLGYECEIWVYDKNGELIEKHL
jgi:hypothetical protein